MAGIAVVVQTAAYVAFGSGHEGDAFDWLSVAAVAAVGVAAGVRAVTVVQKRRAYAVLAVIAGFLALDDASGLHERITTAAAAALDLSARGDSLFLVPYLPLLALAFGILWSAARQAHGNLRAVMLTGLGLLAIALAGRASTAILLTSGVTPSSTEKLIGSAAIHDVELAAWILLAAGLMPARYASKAAHRLTPKGFYRE